MVSSAVQLLSQSVSVTDQVVRLRTPAIPAGKFTSISEVMASQLERVEFSQLCEVAFVHLHLAHYRNQLLHLFVEDAMLSLCITPEMDYGKFNLGLEENWLAFCVDVLLNQFSVLCCALASEFVLPPKSPRQVLNA